jgi:hypothetical protein
VNSLFYAVFRLEKRSKHYKIHVILTDCCLPLGWYQSLRIPDKAMPLFHVSSCGMVDSIGRDIERTKPSMPRYDDSSVGKFLLATGSLEDIYNVYCTRMVGRNSNPKP